MVEKAGKTMPRAFVTGFPVAHSRSPLIHSAWLAEHGLCGAYEAVEIAPAGLSAFVSRLREPGSRYCGGNVTLPHKENAFALADHSDALTKELGAANTLWVCEGRVHATNTDGYGFLANLDERRPNWCLDDRSAVVLGAGGASRAVIQALRERGLKRIDVVNRTLARARELSGRFGSRVHAHPLEALDAVMENAGLFVNTTSLGMAGEAVPAIDFSRLDSRATVTDIVYVPLKTPMLRAAEAYGLATVDGLGMLLHQAVPGFEKWFGVRPAVTQKLRDRVIADMETTGRETGK